MLLKINSPASKADLINICLLGYIFELIAIFVLDLMSAAIHPQVFIIWGSQDLSTKYALSLCHIVGMPFLVPEICFFDLEVQFVSN